MVREAVHHNGPDKVHHVLPRRVTSQQTCQKSQHQTVKHQKNIASVLSDFTQHRCGAMV